MNANRLALVPGILALGVLAGVAGCSEPAGESPAGVAPMAQPPVLEAVERIALRGEHASDGTELDEEARPAVPVASGEQRELCFGPVTPPVPRSLVLAFAANAGVPRVVLRFAGDEVAAVAGAGWRELALELEPGAEGCATASVEPGAGKAGGSAWLSDGSLRTSGRQRPWVIVYVVDSLRHDRTPFGRGGATGGPALAPAFEALARDALVYERASASSSWTRPSVASILTGVGPSAHGVLDRQDRLPPWVPRLQQSFGDAGWLTVAVSTNPNILPVFGFLDGFDRFIDVSSDSWLSEQGYERLGTTLIDVARQSQDAPLFLYVHDNEPHAPYRPLARYREMFGAEPEGSPAEVPGADAAEPVLSQAVRLQQATIRSTSDRFGALMDELRRLGRYDDAVVVLTGDHGEEFGEHGATGHGQTLYQEQLHVPLVIKPPRGRLAPQRIATPAALEGIASATLELAGAEAQWNETAASILPAEVALPEAREPLLIAELQLAGASAQTAIRWPWKLLRTPKAGVQLFDLADDPAEQRDRAVGEAAARAALEQALDARLALARSGLEVSCVAGAESVRVTLEIEFDGALEHDVQRVGLEPDEDSLSLAAQGARIDLALQLRAAEEATGLARFDRVAVARSDPDRDRIRVPQPPGDGVRLRATGIAILGPDGQPLPTDGTRVSLSALEVATPPEIPARAEASCRLFHLRARGVRAEDADDELEARLRALGYL